MSHSSVLNPAAFKERLTSRPYKSKTRWFEIIPTSRGAFSGSNFPRFRRIPLPILISLRRADCLSEISSRCIQGLNSSRKHFVLCVPFWSGIFFVAIKRMGATYVGVRRAHPYSWLLSSPQQPLETEDPPTVSLAPHYTSQRPCRATGFLVKNQVLRVCCEKRVK